MANNVTIIGAGNLGKAVAAVLARREDARVRMWDKDPERVPGQGDVAAAVSGADVVFFCVPSWVMRDAVSAVAPHLKTEEIVVSMAKGLEGTSHKTMDALLAEVLPPGQRFALMSGPMLSVELMKGLPGAAAVAASETSTSAKIEALFAGTNLRVERSTDLRGIAIAGVLKNVYALALGVADGLVWEGNAKGLLVARAVREMAEIMGSLGCEPGTILGPAGIGDLVATGFSPHSRNRTFGYELVRTGKCDIESEGCASIEALNAMLGSRSEKLPVFQAVRRTVAGKASAAETFEALL
jgi:glycerol-3-phosphate dehydrogenase (NAD(P)+)